MVETINVAKDAMIKAVTKLKPGDRADIAYTPAVGSTSIEADNGPRSHLAALAQETIRGLSFVRHAGAWNRRDGRKLSFTYRLAGERRVLVYDTQDLVTA